MKAGGQLSAGRPTGEGSPSPLGGPGLVCGAEHNNLFVTVGGGEVGDLLMGMGPNSDVM